MGTPQLFDRYFVQAFAAGFGGGLVAENSEVKIMWNGQDITVATLALDYAGFTPGASTLEITLKNYLSFNPTLDFAAVKLAKQFVRIQIRTLSGKILTTIGHISSPVSADSADGKNTEVDLTITGTPTTFQ